MTQSFSSSFQSDVKMSPDANVFYLFLFLPGAGESGKSTIVKQMK